MSSFLDNLLNLFSGPKPPPQLPPAQLVQVQRQYALAGSGSSRSRAIVVKRDPRPYWAEHGWQHENGIYTGNFQTKFGSWPGYITVSPGGRVEVFIRNPPAKLHRHPHWPCFRARNDGWFFVHPNTPVADVSAGILAVEKTIAEAYAI